MQIIHKIDDFLLQLFPDLEGKLNDMDAIKTALTNFYSFGTIVPKVTVKDGVAIIDVDSESIGKHGKEFQLVIGLCETGKFAEAKPLLEKLISENPANSEYHRILGQIYSEQGDQDEAINSLIDALKWNSKNGWAMLMMGNIFAKYKSDVPTAMKYYDQAIKSNPADHISITNIGVNLMQQGDYTEAKRYFEKSLAIKSDYANTHHALALVAQSEGDLNSAFYSATNSLRYSIKKDELYNQSLLLATKVSKELITSNIGMKMVDEYRSKLEYLGDKKIEVVEDDSIPTHAKMEFAENYQRDKHVIRYKPTYPAHEHLLMHELVHLDFVIEARKAEVNQLFVSTQKQRNDFRKTVDGAIKKLKKMGVADDVIENYTTQIFEGLNRQVFNAPIDLFIESYLYNEFSDLHPYQFLSLYNIVKEGILAVTDKRVLDITPKDVVSQSKVYNLVGALQFKELFGLDLLKEYNANALELKQAETFYNEFKEYNIDRGPGEEYELVQHWAEDLKVDSNFQLIDELAHRANSSNVDSILSSMENDPYGLESEQPAKQRQMDKFQTYAATMGTNMAVVMFMVEALQYFEPLDKAKIKEIAFEIAALGTQGIHPEKQGYKLAKIPNKDFSGFHLLAYYYTSWAIAVPDMLQQLQLPYDNEYQMALQLKKKY